MNDFLSEELVGREPVVLRRRVKWGECDPAGVVYTPIFSEYAISGFWIFLGVLLGQPLQDRLRALDVRTPVRALIFDFRQSLYPDQVFDIKVLLREIGNTSFTVNVFMTDEQDNAVCDATLTAICVHHHERKSRPIPVPLREALVNYQQRFDAQTTDIR